MKATALAARGESHSTPARHSRRPAGARKPRRGHRFGCASGPEQEVELTSLTRRHFHHGLLALALFLTPLHAISGVAEPRAAIGSQADAADDLARLGDLVGSWSGTLGYRDYQSGEWVELHTTEDTELAAGGSWLVTRASFDEGSWTMHTLELTTVLDGPAPFVTLSLGQGELQRTERRVHRRELRGAGSWKVVFEERGLDDGRAANLRESIELEGDVQMRRKEVDFLDDESSWILRNQVTLRRERSTRAQWGGRWRSSNGVFGELYLEEDQGELKGSLDGVPLGRIDVSHEGDERWIAFQAPGADGARIVQARWVDGGLRGTLYSPADGRLSSWHAQRSGH